MANFFTKIFGTHSSHELKKIYPIADKVEALEEQFKKLSDEELRAKTDEFKKRYQDGETLDQLLPEAFATCREASWRVLGMRHYRVQIIGGIVLHQGRIAEMKTGEGKTLMATLPAYLNALTGKGVHIVTVNDYLAKRDSEWMGKVYRFLGLNVGLVIHEVPPQARKAMYAADITYGTNNEFGFDYLRDNMAIYKQAMVQRGHAFAIVDEVDSILIDEARTPLIISGQGEKSSQMYEIADRFAVGLKCLRVKEVDAKEEQDDIEADYIVDEKAKTATLTPHGQKRAEAYFKVENLSDPENTTLQHYINQAIKARGVMQRDVDYVVRDGQIIIVVEFTGRLMFGRRYNEGLHQAIEAKEGVKVQHESKTLATITFQNYFRLYGKLSGMTGTALTEEEEFRHTYQLDVIEIPTNKPVIRKDNPDAVYKNERGKINAIISRIEECHAKGQPILVGTISIEKSEELSKILKAKGVKRFGMHAFLASNTVTNEYYPTLAKILFETAVEIKEKTGVKLDFINLSGGVGIPYTPDKEPNDIMVIGEGVRKVYEEVLVPAGMGDVAIFTELGRFMLAPYGHLVTTAIHEKHTHKEYIGVDACAVNLMRPAMYGAYHHITVLGKENEPCDHKYDVTGSLCENNDKFAIDRMLPKIDMGDILVIHDTGAHGFAMGYNYNGKLKSAEVLLRPDGSWRLIRRAETPEDYFATINDFWDVEL